MEEVAARPHCPECCPNKRETPTHHRLAGEVFRIALSTLIPIGVVFLLKVVLGI